MAETVEAKLAASYTYVRRRPMGRYVDEVRAWFQPATRAYLSAFWSDRSRLEAFLDAVPAGAAADRAAARLVELRLSEEYRLAREHAFDDKVRAIDRHLAEADRGRRFLTSEVTTWIRRLAAIRTWGGRTSELPHDLIHAFRLSPPEAVCTETTCQKTLVFDYAVPDGKRQSAREALVDVGLELDDGAVARGWVKGPELFTRLGEAMRVAAIPSGDWLARAEAIGQTAQLVALGIEPQMPSSRCAREAVSPVVLLRICDGIELRVVSAMSLGQEDTITIGPTPGVAVAPRPQRITP
jgi:hypothetical protein